MSEEKPRNESLSDEFQALGKNLVEAMRAAWESPERKHLQQEIESGLVELESTIKREADKFTNSPTGQQLKNDVNSIGEKINTSETPELIRQELIKALQAANFELQNIINRWSPVSDSEHPETNNQEGQG